MSFTKSSMKMTLLKRSDPGRAGVLSVSREISEKKSRRKKEKVNKKPNRVQRMGYKKTGSLYSTHLQT